jgi:hypothetical protein
MKVPTIAKLFDHSILRPTPVHRGGLGGGFEHALFFQWPCFLVGLPARFAPLHAMPTHCRHVSGG